MLTPFRAIRRKLHEIRYYSAARPTSGWSRAADAALLAGLLSAVPLTWALDRGVAEGEVLARVTGKLFTLADGSTWAATTAALHPTLVPPGAVPAGAFGVTIETERRGWPFATSTSVAKTRLAVEHYIPRRTLTNADLPPGDPMRETIAAAQSEEGDDAVLDMLRRPGADEAALRPNVRGWVANAMLYGVLLPVTAWSLVGLTRIFWLPVERRRLERRVDLARSGRCAACGYDLRGNPFGGHCPECGTVL